MDMSQTNEMTINTMSPVPSISVHRLSTFENLQDLELIDVRTPAEFRELHALPARNVPLDRLDPHAVMRDRRGSSGQPVDVICRTGSRSAQACRRFHDAGYSNVVSVEGGRLAWERSGLPVVCGRPTISLERQVRIVAGSVLLLGTILGVLLHWSFLAIPAIVGTGLLLVGLTDTCGLALLLAKMPWNQAKEASSPQHQQVPCPAGRCGT